MKSTNPRITVTLTPGVYSVLREMSRLTGNSQSALVGDLLESSLPVFERLVSTLAAAAAVEEAAKSEIAAGMQRAQHRLEAQLDLGLAEFDVASRPVLDAAEKIARRGPRSVSTPVPVTRGSGPHPGSKPRSTRRAKNGGL